MSVDNNPRPHGAAAVRCPYCTCHAKLVGGDTIYPRRRDLAHKQFWHCVPCKAWVGCHDGTATPFGSLANRTLRDKRKATHDSFDALWKADGGWSRTEAYRWLADALSLSRGECHIGSFSLEQCDAAIAAVSRLAADQVIDRAKAGPPR